MRRFVLLFLVVAAGAGSAQELRVGASTGTAEIELPGSGWLQAVSGRAVLPGSSLATWTDAEVSVVGEGVEIALDRLSVVSLTRVTDERVGILLESGSVVVRSAGVSVEVQAGPIAVVLLSGELRFADGIVSLVTGNALISRGSVQREIAGPVEFDTALPVLTPLF